MAAPTLDAFQQVFGLYALANRVAGYTGTGTVLQQQLQYDLSFYLSGVPAVPNVPPNPTPMPEATAQLGNWSLAWGPALIEYDDSTNRASGVADNAMYVAKCEAMTIPGLSAPVTAYVVAVAATNFTSAYDWEVEDFNVAQVVDWKTFDPKSVTPATSIADDTPYISIGTATGVSTLLTQLVSPEGAVASGTTLQQFLASLQPAAGTALIFGGHSLAGALAPTLALYLKQQNELAAFDTLLVYPTAGATPGESNFADAFNTAFPIPDWTVPGTPQPYQSWNTMHWNQLDVVPHAWNKDDLNKIPTLYDPTLTDLPPLGLLAELDILRQIALDESQKSGVVYTRLRNQPLPGTLQHAEYTDGAVTTISVPPQRLEDFIRQLILQHVDLYSGIPAYGTEVPQVTGLVLQQPLPQPSQLFYVPGVSPVTKTEVVEAILKQVWKWIEDHTVKTAVAAAETAVKNL